MKSPRWIRTSILLLPLAAVCLRGQTTIDLFRQGRLGSGTTLPAQCAAGQIFFKTDAPTGANLYTCTNPNLWTPVGLSALSGDLGGTAAAATVTGIQGRAIGAATPADQNALVWDAASGQWLPKPVVSSGNGAPPAICSPGGLYVRSDAANSLHELYACTGANSWAMTGIQSGAASARPANCLLGQTFLATDTGVMTYCAATGTPGTWSTMLAGPQGPAGPQGATGATGPQGPIGLTGTAGPAGANGSTVWNGTSLPAAGLGANGDFYLLNPATAPCLYGPKSAGAWPGSCVALVGPVGPTGSQGPAGPIAGASGQLTFNNSGTAAGSDLSQNSDGSISATAAFNENVCAVPFSTAPAFDAAVCNRFEFGPMTASVSSSTFVHLKAGQHLKIPLVQDAAGGRTFSWPANFVNVCQPWPGPNTTTIQEADVMADGLTVRGTGCTTDAVASSLGTGYLSQTYPVGGAAIAANTWLKLSAGKLAPVSGAEAIYGVAPFACAANAQTCEVAVAGQVPVTAEGAITQDHFLIHGTTNPANALDSGQTSQSSICSSVRIGGRALASAGAGALVPIQLFAPGMQGAQLCQSDLPAGSALHTCVIDNDTQSATPLTNAQITGRCSIPFGATIQEIQIKASAGTPSVQVEKQHCNGYASGVCTGYTATALLSNPLAANAGGVMACARPATSSTCYDGSTSSATITISTVALAAGDWIDIASASSGAVPTWATVTVIYQ